MESPLVWLLPVVEMARTHHLLVSLLPNPPPTSFTIRWACPAVAIHRSGPMFRIAVLIYRWGQLAKLSSEETVPPWIFIAPKGHKRHSFEMMFGTTGENGSPKRLLQEETNLGASTPLPRAAPDREHTFCTKRSSDGLSLERRSSAVRGGLAVCPAKQLQHPKRILLGHGVVRLMRNKGLGWGTIWAVRRVVVVGAGGAGKSVFAARLGEATGLPVVELDKIFWRPGLLAIDDQ